MLTWVPGFLPTGIWLRVNTLGFLIDDSGCLCFSNGFQWLETKEIPLGDLFAILGQSMLDN